MKNTPAALTAATLATAFWLFILAGLFFHHSGIPTVLGRFSRSYAVGLAVFAAATPVVTLATRSVFSTSLMKRPDGRTVRVGPVTKLALVAGASLFALGLSEFMPHDDEGKYRVHPFLQAVPVYDPDVGVNHFGFRGEEPAVPKPAGLFRVVILGGSTSFGPHLAYEETYGKRLQSLLQARLFPRRVDVQCAAVPSYTSEHSLIRYATDVIDLDPDVVLVMHGINDLVAARSSAPWGDRDYAHINSVHGRAPLGFRDRAGFFGFLSWYTAEVVFSDFRRPLAEEIVPDPHPMLRNLRSIIVLGKSRGQHVVLSTQPNRFRLDLPENERLRSEPSLRNYRNHMTLPSFAWHCRYLAEFNQRTRGLAVEEQVPLLDLEREVPPERELFLDNVHVSARGALLEAKAAARLILESGLAR